MKNALHQHRLVQFVFVLIVEKIFVYHLDFFEKYHQVIEPKSKREKQRMIKKVNNNKHFLHLLFLEFFSFDFVRVILDN